MRILTYCASALPQATFEFTKEIVMVKDTKGKGEGQQKQGIGKGKADKAFGCNR